MPWRRTEIIKAHIIRTRFILYSGSLLCTFWPAGLQTMRGERVTVSVRTIAKYPLVQPISHRGRPRSFAERCDPPPRLWARCPTVRSPTASTKSHRLFVMSVLMNIRSEPTLTAGSHLRWRDRKESKGNSHGDKHAK